MTAVLSLPEGPAAPLVDSTACRPTPDAVEI
jgi:hypothetical protein